MRQSCMQATQCHAFITKMSVMCWAIRRRSSSLHSLTCGLHKLVAFPAFRTYLHLTILRLLALRALQQECWLSEQSEVHVHRHHSRQQRQSVPCRPNVTGKIALKFGVTQAYVDLQLGLVSSEWLCTAQPHALCILNQNSMLFPSASYTLPTSRTETSDTA